MSAVDDWPCRIARHLSSRASGERERSLVTMVEGVVWRTPRAAPGGAIVYLSPWWRRGRAPVVVLPLRVRLPNEVCMNDALASSRAVRVVCQDLEHPRRGSSAWTAVGTMACTGDEIGPPRAPVIVHDRILNRAFLEPSSSMFVVRRHRGHLRYTVRFARSTRRDDIYADRADVQLAATVVQSFERQTTNVLALITRSVCDLYNHLQADACTRLAAVDLADVLQLSTLEIQQDGSTLLRFSVGGLSIGRSIEASLDSDLSVTTIRLAP